MASPRLPSLEQVRIGIICPLAVELAAALEILDEEYKDLARSFPDDPNAYTVGRVGEHYVVVAGLPSGRTGTSSANDIASHLRRTFKSVRILLLVGIGGGVPTHEHDIRLGDVVVSQPTGKHGGAIHYNFGKAREGGRFDPTDFLNSPSRDILNALNRLQARQLRGKTMLGKYLAKFQENEASDTFRYPGQEKDLLFEAGTQHAGGPDCASCDKSRSIERAARKPPYILDICDVPGPFIHYGLIASADQLMTDSILRDQLNDSYNGQILCFEMEAAGILNAYPCLVIRGISDYCDSHKRKDKVWHGWASAVAAAYTKDFINELPRNLLVEKPTISHRVKEKIFMCPYTENLTFISRKSIVKEIQQRLQHHSDEQEHIDQALRQTRKTAALYGLGGVGKSQIAINYVYWLHRKFPDTSIFWIHAATTQRFYEGYLDIARKCQIPTEGSEMELLKVVKDWLQDERNGKWILVIDNADDYSEFFDAGEQVDTPQQAGGTIRTKKLANYVPRCAHGSILVTSRNKEVAVNIAIQKGAIEVKNMSGRESQDLLSSVLTEGRHCQDDLERLGSLVDYLPLALVQAAAYIEAQSCSIELYIAMFEENKHSAQRLLSKEFATEGRDQDIPNAVATSWMLSFEQIRHRNPRATDLLSLMAFFDRQAIPESLLKDANETSLSLHEAIGQLLSFSLITRNATSTQYDMHRLTHIISQAWQIKNGTGEKWLIAAEKRLLERFPKGDYKAWDTCAFYLPHAQALIDEELGRSSEVYNHDIHLLMDLVGTYLRLRGLYNLAENIDKKCLDYCTRYLDLDHESTLTSMGNLAVTYWHQGRYRDAEELEAQLTETDKRVLGAEHSSLIRISNLASTYWNQGRYKEAEDLDLQVLETSKRVLGAEHPDTLLSMNNVAFTWKAQSKDKEALELMKNCVESRKTVLGLGHPHTQSSLKALDLWHKECCD